MKVKKVPREFEWLEPLESVKFEDEVIAVPCRAGDTSLVPEGWTVVSDNVEGEAHFYGLDFNTTPVRDGTRRIGYGRVPKRAIEVNGNRMLKRAGQAKVFGSLGFGQWLLDRLKEGQEVVPAHLCGKINILLPRTILEDKRGQPWVPCIKGIEGKWVPAFCSIAGSRTGRFSRSDRFICPITKAD